MDTERTDRQEIFGCDIGNGYGFISLLANPDDDPLPMLPARYRLMPVGMPTTAHIAPPNGDPIEVFDCRYAENGAAEKRFARDPERLLHAVKTRLKEGTVQIPGIESPVLVDAVYGAIARDLLKIANEQRAAMGKAPVYDLVFTFPASFSDNLPLLNRMQRSIENVEMGGHRAKVVGRLPEPAAVAIDYLDYMQHKAPKEIRIDRDHFTVLVYDLGHGTFDTAVVTARSKGDPYQVLSKAGLPEVGGKDFDELLYQEICRQLKEQHGYAPGNALERERLRRHASEIKHELSENEVGVAEIQLADGTFADVEVTQEAFEQLGRPLFNQTLELALQMLEDARQDGIAIDAVVLSGGASQMPMVQKGLELLVEKKIPVVLYRPSEAVSFGAARYAWGLAQAGGKKTPRVTVTASKKKTVQNRIPIPVTNKVLEQFTDYGYGLWIPSGRKLSGQIRLLLQSGEKLPAVSEPFELVSASSRMVLRLYRTAAKKMSAQDADVEECVEIMRFPFDVPPNARCQVRITVREDYNVEIECAPEGQERAAKSTADVLGRLT